MAETIGQAFIDIHANTTPFNREIDKDLDSIARDSEKELEKTGKQMGSEISDGIDGELKRRGKGFGKAVQDGVRREVVKVRVATKYDKEGKFIGRVITQEIRDALDSPTSRGVFGKIGSGIADAVGAGFNVSGRSPLIAVLIPALAALLGLILGLVQAVNALVAVLLIVPGILASLGLQIGVIAIAFQGMGTAIQGAFAARNLKELDAALKGLTPSARLFVAELLPLKDLFKSIQQNVQQNFFTPLLGVVTKIRQALGPSLLEGFILVARAAGQFLAEFGLLLASPGFVKFFNQLVPATVRWLDLLGMGLFGKRGFITGIIDMATNLIPFMEKFGEIFVRNLDTLSSMLFRIGTDPRTAGWLDSMADTLQLVFDLLFKVGEFLFVFMAQLDKAGGKEIFSELMEAITLINFFLSSDAGLKAMEGLINLAIIGIDITAGLIIAILAVIAFFQKLAEYLKDSFLGDVGRVLQAIGQFVVNMAMSFINWIARIIIRILEFLNWIRGIPTRIQGAFANFGTLLMNAGRSLVAGLINGIRQKLGELFGLLGSITSRIAGFFGASPAKEGALSGKGWTLYRGQNIIKDLTKGMAMEVPELRQTTAEATSNIVFGPNSIQMTIHGPVPDPAAARNAGQTMGETAANIIAARNTRLAVRTL